jgi:hypothetical protein
MSSPNAGDAAGLLQPECQQQTFTPFTSLPTELRLKIWHLCFTPRRVSLGRSISDPVIDIRCGALLLVNRETNAVFHDSYSYCFDTGCSDGIYFHFALDTLCFGSALISMMRILVEDYPNIMANIQRIEASPFDNSAEDLSRNLRSMSSLQLIIVRWSNATEWKHWEDNWWTRDSLRMSVNNTVGSLKRSLLLLPHTRRPVLATFFSPNEVKAAQMLQLCHTSSPESHSLLYLRSLLNLRAPSKKTINAAEVEMPQEWRDHWPDSCDFAEHGWIAREVEIE